MLLFHNLFIYYHWESEVLGFCSFQSDEGCVSNDICCREGSSHCDLGEHIAGQPSQFNFVHMLCLLDDLTSVFALQKS